MADDITFPIPNGTVVRTTEIGDAHTWHVAVSGTRPGDGSFLVGPEGTALHKFFAFDVGHSGDLPLDDTNLYAPGSQLSDGATVPDVPPGVWQMLRMRVTITGGSVMDPDDLRVALIPFDSSSPPTWGSDAAQVDVSSLGALFLATDVVGAAPGGGSVWFRSWGVPAPSAWQTDATRSLHVPEGCDAVRIVPFTNGPTGPFPSLTIIIVGSVWERIGDPIG